MPLPAKSIYGPKSVSVDQILRVAGYYWSSVYPDRNDIQALGQALFEEHRQQLREHQRYTESTAIDTMPLFREYTYLPVEIPIDQFEAAPIRFGQGYRFGELFEGKAIFFGQKIPVRWQFPVPTDITGFAAIQDRPYRPNKVLVSGVNALLLREADGNTVIQIDEDPLEMFSKVTTSNGEKLRLWLYMAKRDHLDLQQRYGVLFNKLTPSSEPVKRMLSAVWRAWTYGSQDIHLREFLAAACDNYIAMENEVVEKILHKKQYTVVTNLRSLRGAIGAAPAVNEGQKLEAGDFIFDSVKLTDFRDGVPSWLTSLTLPADLLGTSGGVTIPTGNHVLSLATSSSGVTYVRGNAAGEPADVEKFWLSVQQAIPIKPAIEGPPWSANVLSFLAQSWFRYGVSVSQLNFDLVTEPARNLISLHRELIPPWVAHIVQGGVATQKCR